MTMWSKDMKLEKIYTVTSHSSSNGGKRHDFIVNYSFLDYHKAIEYLNELKLKEIENFKEIYGPKITVIHDDDDKCVVRTVNDDDILTIKIEQTILYK